MKKFDDFRDVDQEPAGIFSGGENGVLSPPDGFGNAVSLPKPEKVVFDTSDAAEAPNGVSKEALDLDAELSAAEALAGVGDHSRVPPPFEPDNPVAHPLPALPSRPSQRVMSVSSTMGLLLIILMPIGLVMQHFYLRAQSAEARVTERVLSEFEERGQIYRIDCDGFLTPHRTCSGRMGVDGQAQVKAVRYSCGKDGCAFECGDK